MAEILVRFSHSVILDEEFVLKHGIIGPDFTPEQEAAISLAAVDIWNSNELDNMYMTDLDISDIEYEE
jgi:hypothetical protein